MLIRENETCPLWIRAKKSVDCLIETITNSTEKECEKAFDHMLDKNAWFIESDVMFGDKFKDNIKFGFKFTNEEAPDFTVSNTVRLVKSDKSKVHYNALIGIPYPALFAMKQNESKKNAFLAYINIIEDVLRWQAVMLLNIKYKVYDKEKKDKAYNDPLEIAAYIGQFMCMLSDYEIKMYDDFMDALNKGKEYVLLFLDKVFEDNYACNNLREFFVELSDENYKDVKSYFEQQRNLLLQVHKEIG